MDAAIHPLSLPYIVAKAKDAVERHIPLEEANHYEGPFAAAFAGAYSEFAKSQSQAEPA